MNRRVYGLYRAMTSKCPNEGCDKQVQHDTEEGPEPCCDGCWLEMGVRELLAERAQALTSDEIRQIFGAALEDPNRPHEHPASVALYDLGQSYEQKAQKFLSGGDKSAACLLSGVLGDLQHVREMI